MPGAKKYPEFDAVYSRYRGLAGLDTHSGEVYGQPSETIGMPSAASQKAAKVVRAQAKTKVYGRGIQALDSSDFAGVARQYVISKLIIF